jgi:hypothetical protein
MKFTSIAALSLTAALTAQTYTLTDIGTQCGGDLHGQVVTLTSGVGLRLGVTGAQPHAFALQVIGGTQTTPIQLPGSQCQLIVDPRVMQTEVTSPTGTAAFHFRVPPVLPITFDCQAVIIGFSTTGLVATSTDGVRLTGV